jgi:hypothetical protein
MLKHANMTEKELSIKFCKLMQPYFHIDAEIWDDAKVGRIDFVFTDKATGAKFGIEVKHDLHKRGGAIGEHIAQCMNYSRLTFKGQKLPIFLYPAISHRVLRGIKEVKGEWTKDVHDQNNTHHTVNGILSHLNIGEIRKREYTNQTFWDFVYNNHLIYRCLPDNGLHTVNYNQLLTYTESWEQWSPIFKHTSQPNPSTSASTRLSTESEPEPSSR